MAFTILRGDQSKTASTLRLDAASGQVLLRPLNGGGQMAVPFGAAFSYSRASTLFDFDATGTLAQAAVNTPMIGHDPATLAAKGWASWQQITNQVLNPRAEGAVVGSPGTLPTDWGGGPPAGIAQTIVGTGTEGGIPYVDIAWSGTYTGGGTTYPHIAQGSSFPASFNQYFAMGVNLRLVSGALPNAVILLGTMLDSGGGFLGNTTGENDVTPTNAALATQRFFQLGQANISSVAYIYPLLAFAITSGVAVNFTLRIGGWTYAQDAVISQALDPPIILPPVGTPGAATLAAAVWELAPALFPQVVNPAQGAIIGDLISLGGYGTMANLDDGTNANIMNMVIAGAGPPQAATAQIVYNGGSLAGYGLAGTVALGTSMRLGMRWNKTTGMFGGCLDGGAVSSNAHAVPNVTRLLLGGAGAAGYELNGYLARLAVLPYAPADAAFQAMCISGAPLP